MFVLIVNFVLCGGFGAEIWLEFRLKFYPKFDEISARISREISPPNFNKFQPKFPKFHPKISQISAEISH